MPLVQSSADSDSAKPVFPSASHKSHINRIYALKVTCPYSSQLAVLFLVKELAGGRIHHRLGVANLSPLRYLPMELKAFA